MPTFSGAILEPDREIALPTVARIDEEKLILSSSTGEVGRWSLDRVKIVVVGNGYFEVVTEDQSLSLVLDEPEAFQQAMGARSAGTGAAPLRAQPGGNSEPGGLSKLLVERPRHGLPSIPPFSLGIVIALVLTAGYLVGTAMGDLVDLVTTESPEPPETPRADVVVRTLQGSGDETSAPFAVAGPWQVQWSVNESEGSQLEVTLVGENGERTVLAAEDAPGEGQSTLEQGGVFRLEIRSPADTAWSVRVLELANPGEA